MDDVIALARSDDLDRDYLDRWAKTLGVSDQLHAAVAAAEPGEA